MSKRWNEPGDTCPKINSVIEDLIDLGKEDMEEIRHANIALREWGREGWERVEELENEICRLESLLEDNEINY